MSADLVYAAKGNKTDEFYRYECLVYPEWRSVSSIPLSPSGKLPRKGCRGAGDGERYIYMAKGGNTCEFWRYDVVADTWTQLPDVPEQPSGKRVRSGTGMVCARLRDTSNVYLLKGNARDFLRFNTLAGRWEVLPSAPVVTGFRYDEGSWLVYDDSQHIYCHRAKLHEFWKFDVASGTWETRQLQGMPFISRTGKARKSKDGGSATWFFDRILALKGNNSQEFWCYNPGTDSWTERDTVPKVGITGKKKKVGRGADIIHVGEADFIYALKGNKTLEFWQYREGDFDGGGLPKPRLEGTAAPGLVPRTQPPSTSAVTGSGYLRLLGTAQPASSVTVRDVSGRVVRRSRAGAGRLDLSGLSAGVYFVRVEDRGQTSVQRVELLR